MNLKLSLLVAFAAVQCCVSLASDKMSVAEAFKTNEIVADLHLPSAPESLLSISYPSGVNVSLGNELTPTTVKDRPFLEFKTEANAFYTILMTDPDAPSRLDPKFREVRHWLVVNVPGSNVDEGDTIFEFVGSGPPKDTGLHRYVLLVFKQKAKIDVSGVPRTPNNSRDRRLGSSTKTLIEEYQLGEPLFGNFYQAQFDDYVPILHAQLSSGSSNPPPKF